jgi:hypothetical protein
MLEPHKTRTQVVAAVAVVGILASRQVLPVPTRQPITVTLVEMAKMIPLAVVAVVLVGWVRTQTLQRTLLVMVA